MNLCCARARSCILLDKLLALSALQGTRAPLSLHVGAWATLDAGGGTAAYAHSQASLPVELSRNRRAGGSEPDPALVLPTVLAPVPDDTTLLRWANTLRPQTLHALNDGVV